MKVLISGAGGLIGKALTVELRSRGHEVHRLVRGGARAARNNGYAATDAAPAAALGGYAADAAGGEATLIWQPGAPLAPECIAGFDAIVHLAGRPVATLWTAKVKQEILRSRVQGTATLAQAAAEAFRQSGRPRALVCSSAIGYYGSRGDEELVEESEAGIGFLADVCLHWEAAAQPAAMAGVRVAQMRTSLVLSAEGGALARMLPAFRLGLGGKLGSGRQWWSWVTLADTVRAYALAVEDERVHGPLNLAAPGAVTNAEFTRALGRALHRPTLLGVPAAALRAVAGEMAEEMLLASQRVRPKHLLEAGFVFDDPELAPALKKLLA
jgi:hypothetical protein